MDIFLPQEPKKFSNSTLEKATSSVRKRNEHIFSGYDPTKPEAENQCFHRENKRAGRIRIMFLHAPAEQREKTYDVKTEQLSTADD